MDIGWYLYEPGEGDDAPPDGLQRVLDLQGHDHRAPEGPRQVPQGAPHQAQQRVIPAGAGEGAGAGADAGAVATWLGSNGGRCRCSLGRRGRWRRGGGRPPPSPPGAATPGQPSGDHTLNPPALARYTNSQENEAVFSYGNRM